MLDLIKLEKQLDEALDRETTESLLEWLNNKRETFINEPESLSDVEAKVIKIFTEGGDSMRCPKHNCQYPCPFCEQEREVKMGT